jgi:serine/threonine protein phosphatase 1
MRHFRIGKRTARLTEGLRIYAVGDVHGCFNLLADLFQRIELDAVGREATKTRIILLGDMIDRGPQSAEVCQLLYGLRDYDGIICLKGNHEQAMCDVLSGDLNALRFWMSFGGNATLRSWGVDPELIHQASLGESWQRELMEAFKAAVPAEIAEWMANLPVAHREGDYFFVHAGIRPGMALSAQSEDDLLWIREPFLSSWRQHEAVVVHGHSESDVAVFNANRIGIDTGAYRTGCLTALGLEGTQQWTVCTSRSESDLPSASGERSNHATA